MMGFQPMMITVIEIRKSSDENIVDQPYLNHGVRLLSN